MGDEAAKVEAVGGGVKLDPTVEDGTHPGWAPGAYKTWQTEREAVKTWKATAEAKAAAEAAALTAKTETERALAAEREGRAQDRVFLKAPAAFESEKVQKYVRAEYAEYKATAGDKADSFEKWFASDAVRKDPVLAPHFASPVAAAQAAVAQGAQEQSAAAAQAAVVESMRAAETAAANAAKLPNVNGGADTTQAVSPTSFTADQIAKMSRAEFALHEKSIRKALEARLGVSLGKGRT